MDMNKKEKGIATVAAILVGCGVAIGVMAHKIYKEHNKEYIEAVKKLKKETDFKFSKEFLNELKEELKEEKKASRTTPTKSADIPSEVLAEEIPVSEELIEDTVKVEIVPADSDKQEDIAMSEKVPVEAIEEEA